jgi:heat shock protein 4
MNALEATVYKYRSDISERLGPFFPESDKEKFGEALTTMEDWLYDNADQEKAVYDAKRKEMLDMFAPGEERYLEAETRPDAFAELEKAIAAFAGFASSTDEQYAHISAEEKQKVEAEVAQAQAFHSEAKAKLDALPATEMPPVKAADISAKAAALTKACKPIMSKPKPLPPKPEPAADAPPAEPATPSEGAGDSPPDEGADAAEAPKKDDMEVE